MMNPAEPPFYAYLNTAEYRASRRWCRDFPERIDECFWRAFLAGFNAARKQTSGNGQEVSAEQENARLRSENAKLSKAVASGILGDLLTPDENEALVAFVKGLRVAQGMPPEGTRRECGSGASAPASPVANGDASKASPDNPKDP